MFYRYELFNNIIVCIGRALGKLIGSVDISLVRSNEIESQPKSP